MNYFRNMIMLSVNGLGIVAYGFIIDVLIRLLNVDSPTAHTIILIGSIIAFLPLIFKVDLVEKSRCRDESLLLFWKRTHHETDIFRQISLLGIIPISSECLHKSHSFDQPSLREVGSDFAETMHLISHFIPVINGYIDTAVNLKKLSSLK